MQTKNPRTADHHEGRGIGFSALHCMLALFMTSHLGLWAFESEPPFAEGDQSIFEGLSAACPPDERIPITDLT